MSGIKKNADTTKKSVEQLKDEYSASKTEIRKLLDKKSDRRDLTESDKGAFRIAYNQAARLAKQLAEYVLDEKLRADYRSDYEKLSKAAAEYGSAVKSKIPDTTMDDVKGLHEVKRIVNNFIFIAKNEELIKQYNLQGGLGILMYGPPGTGKTMIAEAIANAMGLPLFVITPADIFKSYVGESEQAVRAIFEELDACDDGAILFVDECESIFSKRTQDTKDYKSAVTTELLQRMNGFGVSGSKRIMIAATNRPDIIDQAYLRFKRFSYQIYVELPDEEAKLAIIKSKIPPVGLASDVSVQDICTMACEPGMNYSAADLCGIIENACMYAISEMQEKKLTKPIPITRDMVNRSFKDNPPKISQRELEAYKNFKIDA